MQKNDLFDDKPNHTLPRITSQDHFREVIRLNEKHTLKHKGLKSKNNGLTVS